MARGRGSAGRRAKGEGIRGTFKPVAHSTPMSIAEFFFDDAPTAPDWQLTGVADSREWSFGDGDSRPVCEHCGRPIRNVYRCQSREGVTLHLGSECAVDYLGITGAKAHADRQRQAKARERAEAEAREQVERQRLADEAFERDADVYESLRARDTTITGYGRQHVLDDMSRRVKADPLMILSARQVAYARTLIERESEMTARRRTDVPKDFARGSTVSDVAVSVVSVSQVASRFGPMIRAIASDGDGHRFMWRTGIGTRMSEVLQGCERGDALVIGSATVSGQTDDRCLTFLSRPSVARA